MSEKPTLHDIAAMPFSKTLSAIRTHYDPAWGKTTEDGAAIKEWRVQFYWEISGKFDQIIEAETEDKALELAREYAQDDASCGKLETSHEKTTPARASGKGAAP
jgi:hypothetical protein